MCEHIGCTLHSSLYSKEPYIGNLTKQHIGFYKVGFWLIDNLIGFYSVLVTTPRWM
jgi:hypothetical protein